MAGPALLPGCRVATLSRTELATLARGAGFTGKDVDIAVAVALAESGGNPRAHNPNPPDNSYGLWQINMLGRLGPDRRRRLGISSNDALFDPATNARAAFMIWKGSGWNAWTTYTRGTYKKHMATSPNSESSSAAPSTGGGLNPVLGIPDALNKFGETFLKGFASVGAVIVAIVLLILGIVLLLRSQVAAVAPTGKIGKAVKIAKKVAEA